MSRSRGAALLGVLSHVRPLLLASVRTVEAGSAPHGLTLGTRAVLEVLVATGPATVPAVAKRLDLTRQAVQRHVNDLAAASLVRTSDNPAHRRSVLVHVTEAGGDAFGRLRDEELHRLARMAPECSLTEIETAARVLEALARDVRVGEATTDDRG